MHTPLQAMLWELWRTSRMELFIRICGAVGIIFLMHGVHSIRTSNEPEFHVLRGVVIMLLTAVSASSSIWWLQLDRHNSGYCFRLGFARPVSTTLLVVVPMAYTAVCTFVSFMLPALVFQLLERVPIPIVVPAAVIACIANCMMAASWSPGRIFFKFLSLAGLILGLAAWLFAYSASRSDPDPILMAIGKPEFYAFGSGIWSALAAMVVLAAIVTVVCVDRQRHGDHLQSWFVKTRRSSSGIASRQLRPFVNRLAAQCWYEMHQFGFKVLLFGIVAACAMLIFVVVGSVAYPAQKAAPQSIWLGALTLSPLVYQLIVADGALGLRRKQGAVQFSKFDAVVPMRNDVLIAIKLAVIAVSSTAGWLCMALACGVQTKFADDAAAWGRFGEAVSHHVGNVPTYWWIIGASNCILLYLSGTSVMLAFGLWVPLHPRSFYGIFVFLYVQIWLLIWDGTRGWQLLPLWKTYGYLFAVAIVVGCLLALRRAFSAGSLGKPLFATAFCLWTVYVISTIALFVRFSPIAAIPPAAVVFSAALLLVPLATTAFAPLALAAHRHG